MKYKQVGKGLVRTFCLIFEPGDEFVRDVTAFAQAENVTAARLTGIGGFERARLGYFNRSSKEYEPIAIDEQVELLSIAGDLALRDGTPNVHAHALVGHRDGHTTGGHVLEAHVWPTLELFVDAYPWQLVRPFREEIGIATIDLARSQEA